MRILVTGGTGRLGQALTKSAPDWVDLVLPPRSKLDLGAPGELAAKLDAVQPTVIINAGAFTNVDLAETEREASFAVNAVSPGVLAHWAANNGCRFIQISTDYVHDGDVETPIAPDTPPKPVNHYGADKLEGEARVAAAHPCHEILRTSWLYGPKVGTTFVDIMLRLSLEREKLSAVTDQTGNPTPVGWLAQSIWRMLKTKAPAQGGIFHAVASGHVNRHGLATSVVEAAREAGLPVRCTAIDEVGSDHFPTTAARPRFSALDNNSFLERYGVGPLGWKDGIRDFVRSCAPRYRVSLGLE